MRPITHATLYSTINILSFWTVLTFVLNYIVTLLLLFHKETINSLKFFFKGQNLPSYNLRLQYYSIKYILLHILKIY